MSLFTKSVNLFAVLGLAFLLTLTCETRGSSQISYNAVVFKQQVSDPASFYGTDVGLYFRNGRWRYRIGSTEEKLFASGEAWDRVYSVSPTDGDADFWGLTAIEDALDYAAVNTTPSLVMVLPGVYAEQSLELPNGVSLIGVSRDSCIISMTSTNYVGPDARTSALVAAPGNSFVADLTINNTRAPYPAVAIACGWGWSAGTTSGNTVSLRNLTLSSNANDTVYFSGNNIIGLEDSSAVCAGVDTVSIFTSASGTYTIRNCQFETQGTRGNAIYFAAPGTLYSYGNEYWCASASDTGAFWFVQENNGTIYSVGDTFYDGAAKGAFGDIINGVGSGTGWELYVRKASAGGLNDPEIANLTVDADEQSFGNFDVAGDLDVDGDIIGAGDFSVNGGAILGDGAEDTHTINGTFSQVISNAAEDDQFSIVSDIGQLLRVGFTTEPYGYIGFGWPAVAADAFLGRTSANTLTLAANDDATGNANLIAKGYIDPLNLKVNGTEVITPTRVATFAGLNVNGLTNLNDTLTALSTLPHLIGTKDQTAGSGIDTALVIQTDFLTQPVAGDGTRIQLRADDGLQTGLLTVEGILGSDSNEGYGRMAHYPDGVYTPFLQFGGPTAAEVGNLTNLVSVSTWDTGPNLKIGGVPFAVEAYSTITLNQANIVMSADPATTFGIATRGFVLAQNPTFQTLYLESTVSDVSGYKVMSHSVPDETTQSVVSGSLGVGEHLLATWIGPPEGLGQAVLPAGVIRGRINAFKSTPGTRTASLKLCFAIRTILGAEYQFAECVQNDELNGTSLPYELQRAVDEAVINKSDRMVIRWYVVISGVGLDPVVTLEYQGTTDARVEIPSTPGYAASLVAVNVFQEANFFEEGVTVNNSKGSNNFTVYGTGAPPILAAKGATNRLGVGTDFPSATLDVLGASELNGQTNVNGQFIAESSSVIPLIRSGLTSGSGVTTVIQAIAKYTTTPSVGDGPTISLVADDGTQQTVAAIWGKKTGATSGRLELREQTTGSLVLSAHSEGGVFYTDKTRWRDFSAVACASGEVGPTVVAGLSNPSQLWIPNATIGATHISTTGDALAVYFPAPYEPGTIITRIRVKWQAQGDNDGVKLRLLKRDESGTTTAWTVVGAQQTYTDPSAPYDVTVSTYDVSDETMQANTSYMIEVESEKATTGAYLFSAGVETDQRAH